MNSNRWIVITSINPPTQNLDLISSLCRRGYSAVVVGDTTTPVDWQCPGVEFLSVTRQKELFGDFAELIPYRHYSRKNLGYLYALQQGAQLIVDTDDDNFPYRDFGCQLSQQVVGRLLSGPGWVNVYKRFIDDVHIWPRGLPLDAIDAAGTLSAIEQSHDCPIQQFLADNDPDVDAIFRLTKMGKFFFRRTEKPIVLDRNCWVPFNSQNTVFFSDAFPLLYLPCFVNFRMTDIWRSFVAQAALWRCGMRVSFHAPTVEQIRNEHDLMKDFEDEVIGYVQNRRIGSRLAEAIESIPAGQSLSNVARSLWESLHTAEVISEKEISIVHSWLELCDSIKSHNRSQLVSV